MFWWRSWLSAVRFGAVVHGTSTVAGDSGVTRRKFVVLVQWAALSEDRRNVRSTRRNLFHQQYDQAQVRPCSGRESPAVQQFPLTVNCVVFVIIATSSSQSVEVSNLLHHTMIMRHIKHQPFGCQLAVFDRTTKRSCFKLVRRKCAYLGHTLEPQVKWSAGASW